MRKFTLLAALALIITTAPALAMEVQGRASIIDGDSLEIRGVQIRLDGIDAPEGSQTCTLNGQRWRCGRDAAFALADRSGTLPVRCIGDSVDRYGRLLATCYAGGENLNGWLVREGWAVAYRRFSTAYVAHENIARTERRGLWAGEFMMPWRWRAIRSGKAMQ